MPRRIPRCQVPRCNRRALLGVGICAFHKATLPRAITVPLAGAIRDGRRADIRGWAAKAAAWVSRNVPAAPPRLDPRTVYENIARMTGEKED